MAPIPSMAKLTKLMLANNYNHLCLANSQDNLNPNHRCHYLDNRALWGLSHNYHTNKQLHQLHYLDSHHICSNQMSMLHSRRQYRMPYKEFWSMDNYHHNIQLYLLDRLIATARNITTRPVGLSSVIWIHLFKSSTTSTNSRHAQ